MPSAFVPQEDEGYFMTIVQAPSGASLEYTTQGRAGGREDPVRGAGDRRRCSRCSGFSFTGAAPNNGMMFARLRDWEQRREKDQSLDAVLNRMRGQSVRHSRGAGRVVCAAGHSGAVGVRRLPVRGARSDGRRHHRPRGGDAGAGRHAAIRAAVWPGLFTPFRADDPQLVVNIDRDRARSLGLPLREVTDALQVFLGSQYVNDFDFNNRAYRVYVQADQRFRADPGDLGQLYARSQTGQMVPLDTVVRLSETTAPQVISHFNMFRSAEITGTGVPGVSSGQAIAAMEQLARETLPAGFNFAWAGQSLEEIKAGSQAGYIFALSILIVYLVLAAQYESWVLPFIILLGVPLAVFGALSAQLLRGFANDVFCQVGLVMLVGLAAKNSILIVEFAEQLRERGESIVEAAVGAARIRLRPILMTSLAFILGVLPLAFATGAGAAARNSVGHGGGRRHGGVDDPVDRVHPGALRRSSERSCQARSAHALRRGCAWRSERMRSVRESLSPVRGARAATAQATRQRLSA